MTHSLLLAQQSANHRLEELEDRAMNEETAGDDGTLPTDFLEPSPIPPSMSDIPAHHKRNRSSVMVDSVVYPASITSNSTEDKRTSTLLNECIFETDRSFNSPRDGPLRPLDHRQSIVYSEALLRRWTTKIDFDPSGEPDLGVRPSPEQPPFQSYREPYLSQSGWADSEAREIHGQDEQYQAITAPAPQGPQPDKSTIPSVIDTEILKKPTSSTSVLPPPPPIEIFKSFRVGLEDPCYKVLPAAMRKYNIAADPRLYNLYVIYGDIERRINPEEKPLAIFRDLEREGKKPMFMLRKLKQMEGEEGKPDTDAKANQL
jgi:Ras association (RalGDS/AF-6) domain